MDALAGLLDGPRARGAFLLRSVLAPPWSIRVRDEAPLTVVALVRGGAWIVPDGGAPIPLAPGGVAIVRGPAPYTVADAPGTPPQVVIHPGQRCTTPGGEEVYADMALGVRTWGNDPAGETLLLTGTYQVDGEVGRRLLDALPPVVTLDGQDSPGPLIGVLADEVTRDRPGQTAVLDRMLDLLLIQVLRAWFARPGAGAPGWYRAQADPVVGHALRLLHHSPDRPWTVASLARAVGVSRAALARRFRDLVGEPPMAFLTGWRLALAADLLRGSDATLAQVAGRVGYASPFALSAAFKRERGVSPAAYRAAAGP